MSRSTTRFGSRNGIAQATVAVTDDGTPTHLENTLEFISERVAGEAKYQVFYIHHHTSYTKFGARSATKPRAAYPPEDNLNIDKFITDVTHTVIYFDREARRRTVCALLAVSATAMAWSMYHRLRLRQLPWTRVTPPLVYCRVPQLTHPTGSTEWRNLGSLGSST